MANERNLKPFKQGISGNPGGRPKQKLLTDALRNKLGEQNLQGPRNCTNAEAIAQALIHKAIKGDVRAAQEIADRTEGRVPIAELGKELPLANRPALTLDEWDKITRGESLIGDDESEDE